MKHMERLRRKLVYELFIEQFIAMAQTSIKYRSLQQTMTLLKQAERLSLLLSDDKFIEEAEHYQKTIESQRQNVQTLVDAVDTVQGPELPRRESISDRQAAKTRNRPQQHYQKIHQSPDDPASDDDNDEIYNYHRSVIAQIHSTSAENLARFQHTDEADDDVEEVTNSVERLETNLNNENSDYESDTATTV